MRRLALLALMAGACASTSGVQPAAPALSIVESNPTTLATGNASATSAPVSADATVPATASGAGSTTPTTPSPAATPATAAATSPPTTFDPDAVFPVGFERTAARVTKPDGEACDICLWLADDGGLRSLGLMFATSLGAADGMAFVYPEPHTGTFWMKNTVMPLSIAFFSPDGAHMDEFDMEPCESDPCFRYPTPSRFHVAVETTQGGLAALGITPGSTLELLDLPCG